MNISASVQQQVAQYNLGELFATENFLSLGSREAVDKVLSRLVNKGFIERMARGIFTRPKKSKYAGIILPPIQAVVALIAQQNCETIQIHGAEAARLLQLSTQMPTQAIYYTNGASRTVQVAGKPVKFLRTTNPKLLQHAGTKVGIVISALLYLGKEEVTTSTIQHVQQQLSPNEFLTLRQSKLPAWLQQILQITVERNCG